jgi:hypothetical protein
MKSGLFSFSAFVRFFFADFVLTLSIFLFFDCLLAVAVLRAREGGSEWVFGIAKIVSYFFSLIVCCLWLCCEPRWEEANGSLVWPRLSVISFL